MDITHWKADIIHKVESAIAQDRLILPSPPDIVVRVRRVLDDPKSTHAQLAAILATDAVLAARILKVANSVVYRGNQSIDNLQQAISRLGQKLIQTLVTNHALMQMFAQPAKSFNNILHNIQKHSSEVAKLSYAIARHATRLSADDALLAGLVHDIGYLPLLQYLHIPDNPSELNDTILDLLHAYHAQIGAQLLSHWQFPQTIVEVAKEHENIDRSICGGADLVDVILVANILLHRDQGKKCYDEAALAKVSAFLRLGMNPDCDLHELQEHVTNAEQLLSS